MERDDVDKLAKIATDAFDRALAQGTSVEEALRTAEREAGEWVWSGLLLELFDLLVPPARAREHFRQAEALRRHLAEATGEEVDIRVALLQHLLREDRGIRSPKVLELAAFRNLLQSSVTDPLTGLYNQRHFREVFYREIKRSKRYRLSVSLLFYDLDNFKSYNDTCGHPAGDEALRAVAQILRTNCREIDTVCRYGGEEFAILLPSTEKPGARVLGEKLRRLVDCHRFPGEERMTPAGLTISGGIATFPEDGLTVEDLLQNADKALYQAKNFMKNAVCYYYRDDRRASPRIEKEYRLQYRAADGSEGVRIRARTRDISRGGLSFDSQDQVPLSTILDMQLHIESGRKAVILRGRVVRIEQADTAGAFRIGVKFLPEASAEIARVLDI